MNVFVILYIVHFILFFIGTFHTLVAMESIDKTEMNLKDIILFKHESSTFIYAFSAWMGCAGIVVIIGAVISYLIDKCILHRNSK